MNKQESYKTCMILMISSDGNQSNVFFYFCSLPIAILSGFWVAAIGLPYIWGFWVKIWAQFVPKNGKIFIS